MPCQQPRPTWMWNLVGWCQQHDGDSFPCCEGRKMRPLLSSIALQRSGKQGSSPESSLELSPAQASHRGLGAGRKHWDSFPWVPKAGRTPGCRPTGWRPSAESHGTFKNQKLQVRWTMKFCFIIVLTSVMDPERAVAGHPAPPPCS